MAFRSARYQPVQKLAFRMPGAFEVAQAWSRFEVRLTGDTDQPVF